MVGLDINGDGNNLVGKSSSESPLCSAAFYGHFEVIRFFVEQGAMLNGALHSLCGFFRCFHSNYGDILSIISYLLEHGADIDEYQDHSTPLHTAIFESPFEDDEFAVIKYLIMRGANKEKIYRGGGLVFAAFGRFHGQPSLFILNYLHEQGFDLHKTDKDHVSPLQYAIEHFHGEEQHLLMTVRFLVEHGADINHAKPNPNQHWYSDHGNSPLILACRKRYVDICRYLMDHGADVNQVLTYYHD